MLDVVVGGAGLMARQEGWQRAGGFYPVDNRERDQDQPSDGGDYREEKPIVADG